MAYITGVYLQSVPLKRIIYVRPPVEGGRRGWLCKLNTLRHGIVESGCQRTKKIDDWMLEGGGLESIASNSQLYIRRNDVCTNVLEVAKVMDALPPAGRVQLMNH